MVNLAAHSLTQAIARTSQSRCFCRSFQGTNFEPGTGARDESVKRVVKPMCNSSAELLDIPRQIVDKSLTNPPERLR